MTVIVAVAGDALDELITLHYGPEIPISAAMAAVLAANPGLAAHGNSLSAGVRITFPDKDAIIDQGRPALW